MATFYQAPRRSSTDLNGKSGVTWLPIAVTNGAFPSSKFITRKNRPDDGRRASSTKRDIAYILISRISDNGSYQVTEILDDAAYCSFFFLFFSFFNSCNIESHSWLDKSRFVCFVGEKISFAMPEFCFCFPTELLRFCLLDEYNGRVRDSDSLTVSSNTTLQLYGEKLSKENHLKDFKLHRYGYFECTFRRYENTLEKCFSQSRGWYVCEPRLRYKCRDSNGRVPPAFPDTPIMPRCEFTKLANSWFRAQR